MFLVYHQSRYFSYNLKLSFIVVFYNIVKKIMMPRSTYTPTMVGRIWCIVPVALTGAKPEPRQIHPNSPSSIPLYWRRGLTARVLTSPLAIICTNPSATSQCTAIRSCSFPRTHFTCLFITSRPVADILVHHGEVPEGMAAGCPEQSPI